MPCALCKLIKRSSLCMEKRVEKSDSRPDEIPEEGHQKPSLKYLNRYVRSSVGLKWHDLGIELLDFDDVEDLDKIEAEHTSDLDKCCTKMFQLWLRKQPRASWNQLIEALRQIELNALVTKIEQMLLQPKPKAIDQHKQPTSSVEPQTSLISVASLNADFASLLLSVCHILSNSPNQQDNLEKCKEYCLLNFKVSDSCSESLFSPEKIAKIKECTNFRQLFEIVGEHTSWDEHSILTHIAIHCESIKGQQEIKRFDEKLALFEGLQMISSTSSNQKLSKDFVKFCVIIDKPYKHVTIEEYEKIKTYIFSNLETNAYVTVGFIRLLYHSLHIEWLVTVQAVPHMIKSSHQNKDIFIKRNFVFMQIGSELVINDKDALAQLLSSKQLFNVKEILVEQKTKHRSKLMRSYEKASDEVLSAIKLTETCKKISSTILDKKISTTEYLKPSTVADEFSCVTDQIMELLQSHNPKMCVEQCGTIMASDCAHGIKFFSDEQAKQLNSYNTTPLLLQELSHLWSWSNHSVLRILVGFCDEAIKLLDKFDAHLDALEPITSYPVFETIPTDATSQTTFNVKFAKSVAKITLQDVFDMCSLVMNYCSITQYCLQLIATQHGQGCVTIYWSIPKCIINLISSTVLQHSGTFYELGVLEVAIYPDIKITTGNIAKPIEEASKMADLAKQLQHVHRTYNAVLEENRKLKEDQSVLLTSLKTREERVKELEEYNFKVPKDKDEKSKEITETHKSNESLLDQKVVQQNSEILMLEAKFETLKKTFQQLSGIHSKCRSQQEELKLISEDKDIKIQQLHADVERLGNQVKYLNNKIGALQPYLYWTKPIIEVADDKQSMQKAIQQPIDSSLHTQYMTHQSYQLPPLRRYSLATVDPVVPFLSRTDEESKFMSRRRGDHGNTRTGDNYDYNRDNLITKLKSLEQEHQSLPSSHKLTKESYDSVAHDQTLMHPAAISPAAATEDQSILQYDSRPPSPIPWSHHSNTPNFNLGMSTDQTTVQTAFNKQSTEFIKLLDPFDDVEHIHQTTLEQQSKGELVKQMTTIGDTSELQAAFTKQQERSYHYTESQDTH